MAYDSVQTGPGLDCDGRLGQLYQTQEYRTSDRLVVKLCLILWFFFIRTWCSYQSHQFLDLTTSTLCQIRNEQDWTCEIRFAEETNRNYCAIYYRSCCCWTTDACIVWGFHHNHFRILIKYQQWQQSPMCPGCCAMTALCLCLCFLTQVTSVSSWPPAPVSLSREFASLPWPRARATKSPPSAVGPDSQETVSPGMGCLSVKTRSVVVGGLKC